MRSFLFLTVICFCFSLFAGYESIPAESGKLEGTNLYTNNIVTYTGTISYSNAISGTGQWASDGQISISWTVTQKTDGNWNYNYTFAVAEGNNNIQGLIFETAEGFSASSFTVVNQPQGFSATVDDFYRSGGDNTGALGNRLGNLPDEPIHGIRFSITSGNSNTVTIGFDTEYAPMWGDFYANCTFAKGALNSAWNNGFTLNDTDPTSAIGNGSAGYHILTPTPEPTTIALLGLGMLGLRRRKAICK